MDNLQPLMLNNSNGGNDWKEHGVYAEQVYGRQRKTSLGSEKIFEVVDQIIQENIKREQLKNKNGEKLSCKNEMNVKKNCCCSKNRGTVAILY